MFWVFTWRKVFCCASLLPDLSYLPELSGSLMAMDQIIVCHPRVSCFPTCPSQTWPKVLGPMDLKKSKARQLDCFIPTVWRIFVLRGHWNHAALGVYHSTGVWGGDQMEGQVLVSRMESYHSTESSYFLVCTQVSCWRIAVSQTLPKWFRTLVSGPQNGITSWSWQSCWFSIPTWDVDPQLWAHPDTSPVRNSPRWSTPRKRLETKNM